MKQCKGDPNWGIGYHFASYYLSMIKKAIGLDQTILFFYGAAPLKQSSVDYFASLDIWLMNMYGLSETTGSTTIHYIDDMSFQHAGHQMKGAHIKIADPDEKGEGEIRMYGRHIMMGYLNNVEATKECIDKDGYFKSGDMGRLDGPFLKITGRIKELIITAGGENVAPVPIEEKFKNECPACSNIMLVGENQRFIGAFITFKVFVDMSTGIPSTKLEKEAIDLFKEKCGVEVKTSEEACKNDKIIKYIQ